MTRVIEFLASVGQDADLRYSSAEALTAIAPDAIVRCAGDWAALRDALGVTKIMCCDLSKAPQEDEAEETPSRDDDEIVASSVRSAA
jgi:hypothetical protein